MKFHKYHGLGNDYIVIDPRESNVDLGSELIRRICNRNYGIGSDGILYGPAACDNTLSVRIFNPDGSEAEKSGNGLRIFSRYLWDIGMVTTEQFVIKTLGGNIQSQIVDNGTLVRVGMGRVSFDALKIPVIGEPGEVINRTMEIQKRRFLYSAATVGNPHCVISCDDISPDLAKLYGPLVELDKRFPNRTNVQFMKVLDRSTIQIEIWERGAGYTLASGSGSTASAAVAFKTGQCDSVITVKMRGGQLNLTFTPDFDSSLLGPVVAVCHGEADPELLLMNKEE